jgi:ribose transport system substrate-binding protein
LAYITNGVASFWNVAAAGVKAGEKEFGVRCEVLMPPEGIADQNRMLENLLATGVDGVAISPIDADNQTQLLNEACRHTKLITQDCDAPRSDRLCYIGMDNYVAGRMAGQLVKEALPDGGELVIFVGRLEQVNARLRRQGVIDELLDRPADRERYDKPGAVLRGDKYVILDTRTDQLDPGKAKAQAEDAIARYPHVKGLVGLFAYNPPQCLAAVSEAGKLDQIRIVGFDEEQGTLQGIADGKIYGTVVQNPYEYGRKSVEILKALVQGDTSVIPADRYIDIPAQQIRRDNVQAFWDDLKAKMQAAAAP